MKALHLLNFSILASISYEKCLIEIKSHEDHLKIRWSEKTNDAAKRFVKRAFSLFENKNVKLQRLFCSAYITMIKT